jgi:hypothetical protein
MNAVDLQNILNQHASDTDAIFLQRFFKTGPGEYGEGDLFIGLRVPQTRQICRDFFELSIDQIEIMLGSPIHEHRLAGLIIMSNQAKSKKFPTSHKELLYELYLRRTDRINNWDLVDTSCRYVVGGYLMDKPRDILYQLAESNDLWERRIAIVSTWEFIRHGDLDDTFRLSKVLKNDKQDLIHKASGWMLREAGKKDIDRLVEFLDENATTMPRTMLRYSIEKLPETQRRYYLGLS